MRSNKPIVFSIRAPNSRVACVTQARGILGNHIQNRLNVRRRAGDHAQDFARRGLLLQSFGQIAIARLQFLEQTSVLDGNDGLVGEGTNKLDLFFSKRLTSRLLRKNTPARLSSLSIGTPSIVRKPLMF